MSKDKAAQLEIRRKEFHTKAELKQLINWMKRVTIQLENQQNCWLVKQKQFAPIFRFSLMK
jgi:hypothetical protein